MLSFRYKCKKIVPFCTSLKYEKGGSIIKKVVIFFIIFIIVNTNFVLAKFVEKYSISYQTKIAVPICIVESDEKKIVTPLASNDIEEFYFSVKNYDEKNISSMSYGYYINLNFGNSDVKYEVFNITEDKKVGFKDRKSELQYMDFDKREVEYKLVIDLINSNINETTNIDMSINTVFE